jgi:hypothetical protein
MEWVLLAKSCSVDEADKWIRRALADGALHPRFDPPHRPNDPPMWRTVYVSGLVDALAGWRTEYRPLRVAYAPDGRDGDRIFPLPHHWVSACVPALRQDDMEHPVLFMRALAVRAELAGETEIAADLRAAKANILFNE